MNQLRGVMKKRKCEWEKGRVNEIKEVLIG